MDRVGVLLDRASHRGSGLGAPDRSSHKGPSWIDGCHVPPALGWMRRWHHGNTRQRYEKGVLIYLCTRLAWVSALWTDQTASTGHYL